MGAKSLAAKRARKRQIRRLTEEQRSRIRDAMLYEGSPLHKREPNNFGLTPPTDPREEKTLCDEAGIVDRAIAFALWNRALEVGLVSEATVAGDFPKHVWVLDGDGSLRGHPRRESPGRLSRLPHSRG